MPPSLSAIERSNPPPRRKSCAACIKAKRRCDLRQPSCLRCTQRKLTCSYPKHPEITSRAKSSSNNNSSSNNDASPFQTQSSSSSSSSSVNASTSISTNTGLLPHDLLKEPSHPEMLPWETNFHFNMDMASSYHESCSNFPTLSFNEPVASAFPGLEFLDDMVNVNMSNALDLMPPPPPPLSQPTAVTTEDPMPVAVRSPAPKFGSAAAMSRVQLLQAVSELVAKRLQYLIDVFKGAPEKMALEGRTVWCHQTLYQESMPGSLEDALSACALYRAKNTLNGSLIQRIIETRYQKLIASSAPTSSSTASNGREMMARVQALLLYQSMLSFDESHTARAMAEETRSVLSDAATSLAQFVIEEVDDDDDNEESRASSDKRNIPLYPLSAARALFADWAYRESMRRTLLMGLLFVQIQYMLRADFGNTCCEIPYPPSPFPSSSSPSSSSPDSFSPSSSSSPFPPSSDASLTVAAIQRAISEPPYKDGNENTLKCDSRFMLCGTLTLSAHLWAARDAVEFAVAWRGKRHIVARPWNAMRKLESSQPDDLDEMGRIFMTTMMGIEEARAWFASRGATM